MLKTKLLFFGIRLFVFTGLTHLQQCIMPRTCIYLSAFIYRRCDSRLVEDGYTRHHCGGRLVALPFTRRHHHYGGRLSKLPLTRTRHRCGGRLVALPFIRIHHRYDRRLSACLLPMPGVKYQRSGW